MADSGKSAAGGYGPLVLEECSPRLGDSQARVAEAQLMQRREGTEDSPGVFMLVGRTDDREREAWMGVL